MNNELELARWIEGKTDHSSLLSGRTRTYSGRALADSQNGKVLVDLGGNIITEGDAQGIEIPCGPQVKQGDKVLVTTVNGSPYVSSVDGWGDYVGAQASFASAYVGSLTAREITADQIQASVGYFGDLEAGNITADKLTATAGYIDRLTSNNITTDKITATTGYIDRLTSNSITTDKLVANQGVIDNLSSTYATIDELHSDYANIRQLDAGYAKIVEGRITNAVIDQSHVTNLSNHYAHIVDGVIDNATIDKANVNGLAATYATINELHSNYVTATNLASTYATINELHSDYTNTTNLQATYATINELHSNYTNTTNLQANYATISRLESDYITADDIESTYATISELHTDYTNTNTLRANYATISRLESDYITADDIESTYATIDTLESDYATISELHTDYTNTNTLQANYASIDHLQSNYTTTAELQAGYATISQLESDYASIDYLQSNYTNTTNLAANYAQVGLANVNNAWVENGVIKNGAISDGMINSVSANKLTAGTIDASRITVTNLNADNITVGTINGQLIGQGTVDLDALSEDVYTESEIDTIVGNLNDRIDGAIETFTGTVMPTLNNAPANSWTTNKLKDQHVGDVYYVVNSESQQNGYCYRFTKSGNTYSWQLIKDSDVTAALSRLQTAEGKITTIEQFDSDTSTWMTNTDTTIGQMQTAHTTLAGRVDDAESSLSTKVDQTAYNSLENTVNGHTQSIGTLTTTTETLTTNVQNAQSTANQGITSTTQLWYSKANSTAPSKPSAHVTSTATTGGAWRTVVPAYNASYPYYFYCYEYLHADGSYTWSAVIYDQATTESQQQARKGVADAATAQSTANTANTNASNAVSTANTAKSTADNAKTTAEGAASDASTAVSTANTANTNASNAVSTANTANTNASNAVTTANTANTNASNAVTTANTANTNAGNALNAAKSKYATSSTAASQAAKVASCSNFSLFSGADIYVKFTNANTVAAPTLNVNSTGAKTILAADGSALDEASYWKAGETVHFVYNGTNWIAIESTAQEAAAVVASTVTTVSNKVNTVSDTVDEHTRKIGNLETTVATKADGSTVESVSNRLNTVSDTVDGHTQSISSINSSLSTKADSSTVSTLNSRVNTISDTVDGHTQSISSINSSLSTKADSSTVSTLSSKVNTIESDVNGNKTTISNLQTTTSSLRSDLDNLEIGGRNLVFDSTFANIADKWTNWGNPSTREVVTVDGKRYLHVISSGQFQGYSQNWTKRNGPGEIKSGDKIVGSVIAYGASDGQLASIGIHFDNASSSIIAQRWAEFNLTTEPTRYVFGPYTVPDGVVCMNVMVGVRVSSSQEVWIGDVKLEKGTIATDWTPAPEDMATAESVTTLSNTVNTVQSTAESNSAAITGLQTTVATKADGSTVSTLQSNVSSLEQDLSGFKTTVSSTYSTKAQLSDAIDSIEVGGRNLLPLVVSNDYIYTLNGIQMSIIGPSSIRINGTASATTVSDDIFGGLELDPGNYLLWMTNTQGDEVGFRLGHGPSRTHVYSSRGTYTRDNPYKFTVTETDSYWVRVIAWKDVTFDNFETRFMLEKGNKATDWTPAPEDMATSDEVEAAQTTANNALARAGMFKINTYERSFTTAQWKNYGVRGTATTWTTGSGYDNSKLRVGDTAYMTGTVTDGAGGTATIIGNVTAINGTTSVILVSQQLIFGGDALDTTFSRVVQAETKIDQNDEAITLTAEKIDSLQIGGRNIGKVTDARATPTTYNALDFYLSEPLEANQTYTLQLWDVDVAHSAKTTEQLGVWVYYCGDSIYFGDWRGSNYFTNGHADLLVLAFTPTETNLSHNSVVNTNNKYIRLYNSVPNTSGTMNLTVGKWKLEKGNLATDWTPAPEDMATAAELRVANNEISSKVSSSDYNGANIASLINQSASTVKIAAQHVEINGTATFNAIKSSLDSNYDAKGAADAIQIGGRNLALGTTMDAESIIKNTTSAKVVFNAKYLSEELEEGDIVTVSFLAKVEPETNVAAIRPYVGYRNSSGSNSSSHAQPSTVTPTSQWTKYSWTVVLTRSADRVWVTASSKTTTDNNVYSFKGFKVERGNKATDWTPAPEDMATGADLANANGREQTIYYTSALPTDSVDVNNTWVINTNEVQNVWTTTRPRLSEDYPVLWIATQRQTVSQMSGTTCSCTTPVIDQTLTVIDGGHITTGTINAAVVDVVNLDADNINTGTLSADRIAAGSLSISKLYDLSVGGRNLFKNSDFLNITGWTLQNATVNNGVVTVTKGSGESRVYQMPANGYWTWEKSTDYIVSIDARISSGESTGKININPVGANAPDRTFDITSTWTRYTYRFTASTTPSTGSMSFYNISDTGVQIELRYPKLEKGTMPTDWTPAPEDMATAAELRVANNEISSKVSTDLFNGAEMVSRINQSASTVKIQAAHVEIDGTTVFKTSNGSSTTVQDQLKPRIYHTTLGTSGANGIFHLATITISAAYRSQSISLLCMHRAQSNTKIILGFQNQNNTDPGIYMLRYTGNRTVYMDRSAAGVYNLYVTKAEPYDSLSVTEFEYGKYMETGVTWEWNTDQISSVDDLAEGYVTGQQLAEGELKSYYASQTGLDSVSTVANAAAPKASAVARTQRIYYRKTSLGSPGQNNTWLASSGNGYGNWSLSVPQLTYNNVKYPYLYTAVQTQTVAQQASGATTNNCSCSSPLLDDSTTIIDGGNIITGSIAANKLDAATVKSTFIDTAELNASQITSGTLSADRIAGGSLSISKLSDLSVGGRNLLLNSDQSISGTNYNVYNAGTVGSDIPAGTKLVASVHVKAIDLVWATGSGSHRLGFELAGNSGQYIGVWTQETGTYDKRITLEWTLNSDLAKGHAWGIYIQNAASGTIEVSNPKLEIGTIATDWTPAPEDMVTNASFDVQNGKIIASVQSLAAGNSTYTDPSGNSATSGIGTKIEQTANDLTVTIASGTSYYATSTTAAGTAAKTATTMRDTNKPQAAFDLVVGVNVRVLFSQANTATSPTLNVDSKGAKPIRVNNAAIASGSPYNWAANTIVTFVYDGTYWQMSEATALGIASAGKATADELATIVRVYSGGVLTGKSGNTVGALVNSSGSFDVVPITWSGTTPTAGTSPLASFGSSSIKLGSSGYNMELTSSSLTFKNGTTVLQQITGTANTMYVSGKKRMVLNSSGLTLYDTDGSTIIGKVYGTSQQHGSDATLHVVETYTTTKYTKALTKPTSAGWTINASESWESTNANNNIFTHKLTLVSNNSWGPERVDTFAQANQVYSVTERSPYGIEHVFTTYYLVGNEDGTTTSNANNSWLYFYSPGATSGLGNNVAFSSGSNMVIGGGEFAKTASSYFPHLEDWSDTGENLYLGSDKNVYIYSNAQSGLGLSDNANYLLYNSSGQLYNYMHSFDRDGEAPSANTSGYFIWRDADGETIGYTGMYYVTDGKQAVQLYARTVNDANNGISIGFDANGNRYVSVTNQPSWQSGLGFHSSKALSGTAAITISSSCTLSAAYIRASYASVVTVYIKFKLKSALNNEATVTVGTIPANFTNDNVYYVSLRPKFDIRAENDHYNCLANISSAGVVTFKNLAGAQFAANTEHVITATYVTGIN